MPDTITIHVSDLGKVSDGYHTIEELYEHRVALFMALARKMTNTYVVWRSQKHSDGSSLDGWFLLGIGSNKGLQITYHLPISKWDECSFAATFATAPPFDGHTSKDVLERLKTL